MYRMHSVDASREAGFVLFDVLRSMPNDIERIQVLVNLASEQDLACVTERVVVLVFGDAGIWEAGRFHPEASAGVGRGVLSWFGDDWVARVRSAWLGAVRQFGAVALLGSCPNAISTLYRWGQLDDNPYREVREHLERAFANEKLVLSFAAGFGPNDSLSGIESLLTDGAMARLRDVVGAAGEDGQSFLRRLDDYQAGRSTGGATKDDP